MKRMGLLALLLLTLGFAALAQGQDALQLAAVQNDALVLAGANGTIQSLPTPAGRGIAAMAWSPDGSLLALAVNDENYTPQLYVTGPEMAEALALDAGPLETGFGVAFSPDGQIIYAAAGAYPPDFSTPPVVELRQIAPVANAQPVTLGQFTYGVGCGGGSPIPADWQLWVESGFGGNFLTLHWTPLGILHSTSCNGTSAAILNLQTGEDRPLGPAFDGQMLPIPNPIGRLVVSPDGLQAAGVRLTYGDTSVTTSLVLIDLATGEITDTATPEQPDQLAWGADGTIYYSTRTPSRDITASFDGKARTALAIALGYTNADDLWDVNGYTASIHRLDPSTGTDESLLTLDAYAVGRMRQAADGALIFSTIPNLDAWTNAIVSGQYNPADDPTGDQVRTLLPVSVYQLPSSAAEAQLIGAGLEMFELRPPSARPG